MGKGTKESPYTRKDVLRLIEEGELDLSGKVFEEGIDLSGKVFFNIILNDTELIRAKFDGSNLDNVVMQRANLQYATFNPLASNNCILAKADFSGAYLKNTEFQKADLSGAQFQEVQYQNDPDKLIRTTLEETDFRNANLFCTNFNKRSKLYKTKLEGACIDSSNIDEAMIGDADWGSYVIGEEMVNSHNYNLNVAQHRYRRLKVWYTNAGNHETAAKFYYREREVIRRVALRRRDRIAGWLSWAVFGHGEGWKRILIWIAGIILLFGVVYFAINSLWEWVAFGKSLYFSTVSFSALGYGSWIDEKWIDISNNFIKGIAAFESLIGISMMALLLVTFVRKWAR